MTVASPTPPSSAPSKASTKGMSSRPSSDLIMDERAALIRFGKLRGLVLVQTWIIGALCLVLAIALPFTQPVYIYYALNPDKQVMRLVGLDVPNMTNRAILSWSVTSITEIMTMGFGDFDVKIPKQKWRFTPSGWDAYVKAFIDEGVGTQFKKSQLVLTTVPSDTPVIAAQFVNPDNVYEWVVQMPVVMTYATNNNVTSKQRGLVTLHIVRVPADVSTAGVAIKQWDIHIGHT